MKTAPEQRPPYKPDSASLHQAVRLAQQGEDQHSNSFINSTANGFTPFVCAWWGLRVKLKN